MSQKTLGVPFDIHSGGQDLIFPHHENELAQSCGANGNMEDATHYARYWLHNGMIRFDGDKMSKSLGNILYINDLVKKYDGEVLRLLLLSTARQQLQTRTATKLCTGKVVIVTFIWIIITVMGFKEDLQLLRSVLQLSRILMERMVALVPISSLNMLDTATVRRTIAL